MATRTERDNKASASHNEEFQALLQELRVLLPGVEVLFAFLLTVPFTERFGAVTPQQRGVYFVALLSAAVASVSLMAPTLYHRLRWREAHSEDVLRRANLFTLLGTTCTGIAIACVVFVVTNVLFGTTAAAVTAGALTATVALFWLGLPAWDRVRAERSSGGRRRNI